MKYYSSSLLFIACLPLLLTVGCATANHSAKHEASHEAHVAPANVSSPELNRIKELAGRWSSTTSMFGKKDEQVFTEYTVTAGGSAVLEKIFPGTPNEMVSVYYDDDNGKLAMTHYCMMRNRPYFSLAKSEANTIKLDVVKVEGLKSKKDPSMGAITLRFEDQDHFSSSCGGDKTSDSMTMRFTRVVSR